MSKDRDFAPGVKLPSTWTDAIEELLSTYASPNFTIVPLSATQIQIVAGAGVDQVCVEVAGRPRWISATINAADPGGAAGTHDIYVTGYANSFTLDGSGYEIDGTNRAFGLKIVASGTPSGTGAEAIYRKVGTLTWSGSAITAIHQTIHQIATAQILDGTIVNADINAAAAIARTKLDFGSGLVNADIASGAAIAYSKLALGTSIVNADIATGAAIARTKLDFGSGLVNADIASSAAIARSKLNFGSGLVNADIATGAAIDRSKVNLVKQVWGTVEATGSSPANAAKGGSDDWTASRTSDGNYHVTFSPAFSAIPAAVFLQLLGVYGIFTIVADNLTASGFDVLISGWTQDLLKVMNQSWENQPFTFLVIE